MRKLDTFTRAYIECALWSTSDNSDDQGGDPLDRNFDASDLAPETLARVIADCERFQVECADDLADVADERAGFLFWLNRNGHGSGFWDEYGLPKDVRDRLSNASKRYGEVDLYAGDDGQLYMSPDPECAHGHAMRLGAV